MTRRERVIASLNHKETDLVPYFLECTQQELEKIIVYTGDKDFENHQGVYFGDDWGQQKGLIMGPAHWRRFIKPRMERMYSKVKAKGKYVIQHSCGDISEILPDLIEIGLDCYQTVQPEVYDRVELKEKFGDRLTFWGTISTQHILPYGTPQEVKQETIRIMKQMRICGCYD